MSKSEKENLSLGEFKKEIADQLLPYIISNLHRIGKIKESELDDKQIVYQKTMKYFVNNHDFEIETLVDHRNSILKTAKEYEKSNFDLSITLYATFIEHTLNYINPLCILNNAGFNVVDISVENEPVDILNGRQRCYF